MVNGTNILVYQGSTAIACTKSDELQVECETIKISDASDGEWEHNLAGRKNWSLSVSWLVSTATNIRKALDVGSRVQLKIKGRDATSDSSGLVGYAILKVCKITMTEGSLCSGSFRFEGDGPLT